MWPLYSQRNISGLPSQESQTEGDSSLPSSQSTSPLHCSVVLFRQTLSLFHVHSNWSESRHLPDTFRTKREKERKVKNVSLSAGRVHILTTHIQRMILSDNQLPIFFKTRQYDGRQDRERYDRYDFVGKKTQWIILSVLKRVE